jgi:hypothetical protein
MLPRPSQTPASSLSSSAPKASAVTGCATGRVFTSRHVVPSRAYSETKNPTLAIPGDELRCARASFRPEREIATGSSASMSQPSWDENRVRSAVRSAFAVTTVNPFSEPRLSSRETLSTPAGVGASRRMR